jgi:hypothetical protein
MYPGALLVYIIILFFMRISRVFYEIGYSFSCVFNITDFKRVFMVF